MFGKKEPPKAPNKSDIDFKFKSTLRRIQRGIDEYDERIEAEVMRAVQARKAHNVDAEQRAMQKIQRLTASKVQKEQFFDNVERVKDRIDDILDKVEVSRTLSETYSGINNLVDSKEMNQILGELDAFNKQFAKANNMMEAFMGEMDKSVQETKTDATLSASIQAMVDQRMKGYEQRVEEQAEAELDASSFSLS